MAADPAAVVTSELLWKAAVVAAALDAPLVVLVARGVPAEKFRALKWPLVAAAALVWAFIWGTVGSVVYWDAVYAHVFPRWSRWLLPLQFGLLYGALSLLFWRASLAAPRWPAAWFVVLGGLVSVPGHAIGIGRGLLRVPMLARASAASALTFGVFEFVVYWCVIVGVALVADRLLPGGAAPPGGRG